MPPKSTIFLFLAVLLSSCTTRYVVTMDPPSKDKSRLSVEQFNKRIQDKTGTITLTTSEEYEAERFHVRGDSLFFGVRGSLHINRLSEIRSIVDSSPLTGTILGLLGGSVGGMLIGQAIGSRNDNYWGGFGGAVIGFFAGAAGGLALGLTSPPSVEYRFEAPRD